MTTESYLRKALAGYKTSVIDYLMKNEEFMMKVNAILSSSKLSEREKVKKLRKVAYHYSRRFRFDDIDVSLIERGDKGLSELVQYFQELMKLTDCSSILDVGCGSFPLTLVSWNYKPQVYYAIDKDEKIINRLIEFSKNLKEVILYPVIVDVSNIDVYKKFISNLEIRPCITIYSRILHVLFRLHKIEPMDIISITPSRVHVILEPKFSLVKGTEILNRERNFLKKIANKCLESGICYKFEAKDFYNDIGIVLFVG